jgi:hypothetical protein
MSLIDVQRRAVRACFGPMPTPAELAQLGDARIWGLYRKLVRGRLREEYKRVFRRSYALLGREAFEALLVHHFEHDPPRSRFFYALSDELARTGVPHLRATPGLPAHAADLLAYEAAVWTVSDLPDVHDGALVELSFERRPVLAPALRLLALDHPVHLRDESAAGQSEPTFLCVYRRPEDKRSRTWAMNGVTFDLLQRFALGTETLTDSVKHVCTARKLVVDERFLDGLSGVLASALTRGVLLGASGA